MDALEWLTAERNAADQGLATAERDLVLTSDKAAAKSERDYWAGYLDAITNAMNELYGPGDVA